MNLQKSLENKLNKTLLEYSLVNNNNSNSCTNNNIDYFTNECNSNIILPYHLKNSNTKNKNYLKEKLNHKKVYNKELRVFNYENISSKIKKSKSYLKEVNDPDILELKTKPWNSSNKVAIDTNDDKPQLKKILFEVRNGLKDVNMVKLKPKKIELGTDSRDVAYFGWNSSSTLQEKEKKMLDLLSLQAAFGNSIEEWKKIQNKINVNNNNNTNNQSTYANNYLSPYENIKNTNLILRSIKIKNQKEKENIKNKLKYENPKSSAEKIAALAYKEIYPKMIYDLKVNLNKNTKYYHDSEEMVRKLNLDNHYDIAKSKEIKMLNIIKNKNNRYKDTVVNYKYYKNRNTSSYYNNNSINNNVSKSNAFTCLDTYCYKIKALNKSTKYLGSIVRGNKNKPWIYKEYYHPGNYTKVNSKINIYEINNNDDNNNNNNNNFDNNNINNNENKAWSCCFNSEQNSRVSNFNFLH